MSPDGWDTIEEGTDEYDNGRQPSRWRGRGEWPAKNAGPSYDLRDENERVISYGTHRP
jgi:hypothetical protein